MTFTQRLWHVAAIRSVNDTIAADPRVRAALIPIAQAG
jgi:hypothetical protein